MGLIVSLRGKFVVQPAIFFEPDPFPGLPGPAVGPGGPKIGPPGPDLSALSLSQPRGPILISFRDPVLLDHQNENLKPVMSATQFAHQRVEHSLCLAHE